MLFGNMLNLDKGIFTPISERSSSSKPSSKYMSDLLAIQDNLLRDSAEELLRTDLLHKGGNELAKRSVGMSLEKCGNSVA